MKVSISDVGSFKLKNIRSRSFDNSHNKGFVGEGPNEVCGHEAHEVIFSSYRKQRTE